MGITIKTKYDIGDTIRLYDGSYTFIAGRIAVFISPDGVEEIGYWGKHGGFYTEDWLAENGRKEDKSC